MDPRQTQAEARRRDQMRARPDDRGGGVDHAETREIHSDHAGDTRDDRLHAGHEAADEDAFAPMALEERLALVEQGRVAPERPDRSQPALVMVPHPEGERVADDGAGAGQDQHRHERQLAGTDESADRDQHECAGHKQPDDEQGLAEADEEHQRERGEGMGSDEVEDGLGHSATIAAGQKGGRPQRRRSDDPWLAVHPPRHMSDRIRIRIVPHVAEAWENRAFSHVRFERAQRVSASGPLRCPYGCRHCDDPANWNRPGC